MRWIEEIKTNPLMVGVKFARYKFAAKMLKPSDKVLEIGCGEGAGSNFFALNAACVLGVDGNADAIATAGKTWLRHNLSFRTMDARNIASLSYSFDAIIMIDFIEHLSEPDARGVLLDCRNMLRPGGMVIIGTPNRNFQHLRSERSRVQHIQEFTPAEFRNLCDSTFSRGIYFSMNDEIVHPGNLETAWFLWAICWGDNSSL
ncbi:MAG: class I SAM-dependent methyltransferase [Thermodesulfobacteriota bacterium]